MADINKREPGYSVDGQVSVAGGMDSSVTAEKIDADQFAYARNISIREDVIGPRAGVQIITDNWDDEAAEAEFRDGRFQGAAAYSTPNGKILLTSSISGKIFILDVTDNGYVAMKPTVQDVDNLPDTNIAWFCQAGNYMVVQDGSSVPLILTNTLIRRADTTIPEVPTGQSMCYGMGLLVVADGRIYKVGDREQASAPSTVLKFTSTLYFEFGGGFIIPITAGNIVGMVFQATGDTASGQGNLCVFGDNGMVTTNLNVPRADWPTTQLQAVALTNIGGTGDANLVTVNNDVFFRSQDGIRSYRQARSQEQGWGRTPISHEVGRIIEKDALFFMERASAVYWNKWLIMTTQPQMDSYGLYFNGLVVFDLEPVSSMRDPRPPAWAGFWNVPGIKIQQILTAVVNNTERCFIFGRDSENKNHVYEMSTTFFNDMVPSPTDIEWAYESKRFTYGKPLLPKQLKYLDLWCDQWRGNASVRIRFRDDENCSWAEWKTICAQFANEDCSTDCNPQTYGPGYTSRIRLPEAPNTCNEVYSQETIGGQVKRYTRIGYSHQIRLDGTGYARISKLMLHAMETIDDISPNCGDCTQQFSPCCPEE